MSILKSKHNGWSFDGTRTPFGGGGKGGGGPSGGGSQQQSNQYSNISPWASPYVGSILGAAQNQVFQTKQNPATAGYYTDAQGNKVDAATAQAAQNNPFGGGSEYTYVEGTPASSEITGMQPYTAYGYQGAGMTPEDIAAAQASVAGFTPLQQQAFQGAQNLQLPGQYGQATNLATQAGQGALGTTGTAAQYGAAGAGYGAQGANIGQGALGYGAQGAQAGQLGAGYGAQGANIGQGVAGMSTDPNAVNAYMSPYLQASLQPQLNLLAQQTGIQGAAQQGAATQAGAFGGSRSALQNALVQQSGNLAQQQAIGQGYNQAYNNAINQMNQAASLGMQGTQQGIAGQQAAMQGAGMGMQGIQSALAGTAQGIQGSQAGLQGIGAQQAGYGMAGTQGTNLANIGAQQLAGQQGILGLQNQYGTQQQQQQQNIINQGMQNYATGQQYPMTQLQQLAALGAPYVTKDVTTTQQAATPSAISQLAGLGTAGIAGLGMYNAMNKKP
jgi:hypothetical protein